MKLHTLLGLSLLACATAQAQYTALDFGASSYGYGISNSGIGGQSLSHAMLGSFDGQLTDGQLTDVHPAGFTNSIINYRNGTLSVGSAGDPALQNRAAAMKWDGVTASPLFLPFTPWSSSATATDGLQIVGTAYEVGSTRDVVTAGKAHALVWDAASGQVIADLSDGKDVVATGVGNGTQVGYENKGSFLEARLWFGAARGFVNLHQNGWTTSSCSSTDGVHQVGLIGQEVRLFDETRRGQRTLMTYAAVWQGSAASVITLGYSHPSQPIGNSVATDVSGNFVCGVGIGKNRVGTTVLNHAVVWSLASMSFIDLHDILPAGFLSSRAEAVDASGNVTGFAVDTLGKPHAILWKLQ